MKRKRHTPEQIVGHLREAEKLLSEGKTITQVMKKLGVTEHVSRQLSLDRIEV